VTHWWRSYQLSWFRQIFCQDDSYNTLCVVPLSVNETEWCSVHYNATNCTEIRDSAQDRTIFSLNCLYYFSGAWALLLLFLVRKSRFTRRALNESISKSFVPSLLLLPLELQLTLALDTLKRIITIPIVQKSRQYNVPAWLALPTIICSILGGFFSFGQLSALKTSSADITVKWIGPLYLATGGRWWFCMRPMISTRTAQAHSVSSMVCCYRTNAMPVRNVLPWRNTGYLFVQCVDPQHQRQAQEAYLHDVFHWDDGSHVRDACHAVRFVHFLFRRRRRGQVGGGSEGEPRLHL